MDSHAKGLILAGAVAGLLIFVGLPETARWLHGGAFAQTIGPPPGGGNCNNYGTFNGTMNNNCPTIIGPPRKADGLYETQKPE